ncbi:SWI/SNF-related matrix-associated actin-dependent regulator of chromatin subfamily A-like protein 1 [Orussus abietinus]|uniref:SWI/SNF-related matrix-associated actin-dependent regulator of chromatin subfamily A-like protein 1 n=1 Tax=Orussus abietinus TaxID=222816 RepID=UPI0006257E12|nr:SWI/SNF-related matrix-associated actin-dependent regulator of chromatin subfamily A-like protein 1 [Orussus abietinus]
MLYSILKILNYFIANVLLIFDTIDMSCSTMTDKKYSLHEIEQKRLLALQRKEETVKKLHATEVVKPSNGNAKDNIQTKIKGAQSPLAQHSMGRSSHQKQTFRQNRNNSNILRSPLKSNRFNPIEPRIFFGQQKAVTGKCYMISEVTFAIETDSFHQPLIDIYKSIPSKSYDLITRIWSFHISDYELLMEKLLQFRPNVCIAGLPKIVMQTFMNNSNIKCDMERIDLSSVDPVLLQKLFPFQLEGVCFGISKKGRCIIADDMGLGKTIQALGIAHYYKNDWPLLIVAPSSMRYQWSEAIFNFLPSIPTHYVQHFTSGKDYINNSRVVIVSYDLLSRALDTFLKHVFGFIILDESHTLKSLKTARTKAVQTIATHAHHVVLLSGTPALSRPLELYSQLNIVKPGFMPYHDYGTRYCAGIKRSFGWDFSGSSNMQELQLFLKATCLLRRLKSNVLSQLPSKIREVVVLDPVLIEASNKELQKMSKNLNIKNLKGFDKQNAFIEYYNISSKAKIKAVCNYVTDLLESGKKFLIFGHHHTLLDAICEVVTSKKIQYIRIDGKTSSEQRKLQVDKFQEYDDYRVAILSITAANAGLTLTAAQLVVFAELFWNPGILNQAEDRVHRIGQENSVVIQYLVARKTVDDHLWPLIEKKLTTLNEAGLNEDLSFGTANVTLQKVSEPQQPKINSFFANTQGQTKMNDFVEQKSSTNITDNDMQEESSNSNLQEKGFGHLLELNAEDFDDIDLDSMT